MSEPLSAVGGLAAAPQAGAPAAPAPAAKEASERGEAFERMLVGQLTRQLVDNALSTDDSASAAVTAYKDLLPDALTEALMSGGGIGLAKSLEEGVR